MSKLYFEVVAHTQEDASVKCLNCGYVFSVEPESETNLTFDLADNILKPKCPGCGLCSAKEPEGENLHLDENT